MGDCHSLLQLICSDFPLGSIKNAWNTALSIYTDEGNGPQERSIRRQQGRLPFADFLDCLNVTFLYERYLLELRKRFFDANKNCTDLEGLSKAIHRGEDWAGRTGWPAPSAPVLLEVVEVASEQGTQQSFEFRKVVKLLCCHPHFRDLIEDDNVDAQERAWKISETQGDSLENRADSLEQEEGK